MSIFIYSLHNARTAPRNLELASEKMNWLGDRIIIRTDLKSGSCSSLNNFMGPFFSVKSVTGSCTEIKLNLLDQIFASTCHTYILRHQACTNTMLDNVENFRHRTSQMWRYRVPTQTFQMLVLVCFSFLQKNW